MKKCVCFPDGPFCGACAYDEDGELVRVRVYKLERKNYSPNTRDEASK